MSMVTDPATELVTIGSPASDTATALVTPTTANLLLGVVATAGAAVNVATATTPLDTSELLIPASKHVYNPDAPLQEIDFPAFVASGPGMTVIDVKSAVGYANVHWRPAAGAPVSVRFN